MNTGECPDSQLAKTSFRCAALSCTPEYRDWAAELAGNVLHVTGAEIMPSSVYRVAQLALTCSGHEDSCIDVLYEFPVYTAHWGNVDDDPQLNVLDVASQVDKVKDQNGARLHKPRMQLQPNLPNPMANVGVLDIACVVDALKGKEYPFQGPTDCP